MGVLTRFRLDGGTNQQAARKLLPAEGLLRRVVNLRLVRDNELGVRPGFTALAATVINLTGTVVAKDLFQYDGRLFAFGARSSSPTVLTLFEYVGATQAAWRRVTVAIPDAVKARSVGQPTDQDGAITSATCAAYNGEVLVAWQNSGSNVSYLLLFRASDDAPLIYESLSSSGDMKIPVVLKTTGVRLHIVGVNSNNTSLEVKTYNPGVTATLIGSPQALQTVDTAVFAAAGVVGSPGGYVTVGCLAGDLVVRHYNDSHVQQMTRTVSTVVPQYLAISADGATDRILIGYRDNADSRIRWTLLKLSDGTTVTAITLVTSDTTTGMVSAQGGTITAHITSRTPDEIVNISGTGLLADAAMSTEAESGGSQVGFVQGDSSPVNVVTSTATFFPGSDLSWFQDFGTAVVPTNRLGSLCVDSVTGLYYAITFATNNDLEAGFRITEWKRSSLERRQTALQGGQLHIAGAIPLVFDGKQACEVGFGEAPVIYGLASSNSTGSITSSAAYFIQAFAEGVDAKGNVHRGPPSAVYSITTGAADDTITGTISSLHSLRNYAGYPGASYRIVICRTAALADKTAGENLYRETFVNVTGLSKSGDDIAFTLTTSDDGLRALGETKGTIYTQGQTPVAHQAPPPFSYVWPTNERLAIGGLPVTSQWLQSKLKFPAEAMHFSDADLPQFQGSTDEAILAVGALSGSIVAFTRRTISLWQGEGPDHSGQGEFSFAGFLSRQGGIVDWRSLVETDEGLFFQRESDQICMLQHGGAADWQVGQPIRDELLTYPNILAAVFLRHEHCVVFAVENDAQNAGELLIYDLRRKVWTIDDVYAKALCEYQGRLAYADASGIVYQQHASAGSGTMPSQSFETFDFDFGTGLSWGEVQNIGIVGTKKGDCTATLDVTYDSGASYTTIQTFTITTAGGYVTGKQVELEKAVPFRKCSRWGLRLNVTGSTDSEGLRINELVLETERIPGMARLPARDTH